jgi:hypothetical protein
LKTKKRAGEDTPSGLHAGGHTEQITCPVTAPLDGQRRRGPDDHHTDECRRDGHGFSPSFSFVKKQKGRGVSTAALLLRISNAVVSNRSPRREAMTPPAQYAVQSQRHGEVGDRTHDLSLSDIVVSSKCCVASERLRHDQPDSECANFADSFY